jgi:hypothetical protein
MQDDIDSDDEEIVIDERLGDRRAQLQDIVNVNERDFLNIMAAGPNAHNRRVVDNRQLIVNNRQPVDWS